MQCTVAYLKGPWSTASPPPEIFSSVGPEGNIAQFDTWGKLTKGPNRVGLRSLPMGCEPSIIIWVIFKLEDNSCPRH